MKNRRSISLLAVLSLVIAVVLSYGCGGSSSSGGGTPPAPATLASITVSPATAATVTVGNTQQFTATGVLSDSTTTTVVVSWSTSSAPVATIDTSGLATAVAPGTAVITATSGTFTGTASMTVVAAPLPTYTATLYMASEAGGHIGVFPVTIDPNNTTNPITVNSGVKRIQLHGAPGSGIVFHDVRLDAAANRIYYSAFFSDLSGTVFPGTFPLASGNTTGHADIGYVDLSAANTGNNAGINSKIDIDGDAAWNIAYVLDGMFGMTGNSLKAVYCASGQSDTYFFPMTMSFPAYIDAVPKTALAGGSQTLTSATTGFKRTYISSIDDSTPMLGFLHGSTNKAGTKMYVATNEVVGVSTTSNLGGVFRAYMLNTSDLISGSVTTSGVTTKASYTVAPLLASIAYRSSWSSDTNEKYILQAGSDRMLIINSSDLTLNHDTINDTPGIGGGKTGIENHDVMTTPDGKYAILAIRYKDQASDANKTSGVQLYDIANKRFIGGITTTCGTASCHAPSDGVNRPTCGIVGKFN